MRDISGGRERERETGSLAGGGIPGRVEERDVRRVE